MLKNLLLAGVSALVFPALAAAQQLNGGEIGLSYTAFNDSDELNATKLHGNIEVGFTRSFALQFDIITSGRDGPSDALDGQSLTLHPIWHYTENTSFGLFVTQDMLSSDNSTAFGAEFGWEERDRKVEVYLAQADDGTETATLFGANGEWDLTYAWAIGGSIEYADFESSSSIRQLSIRGLYDFGQGGGLYAGLGSVSADNGFASNDDTFLQVGATFTFGSERGATFGERGVLGLLQ